MRSKIKSLVFYFFPQLNTSKKVQIIKNYFNSTHDKTVLISYMTEPFTKGIGLGHTNHQECYSISEIFKRNNYNVDIIDYDNQISAKELNEYDILIGFGEPIEIAVNNRDIIKSTIIAYATGCSPQYNNRVSFDKVVTKYLSTNKWLIESARIPSNSMLRQFNFPDHLIILGNNFTKNTYYPNNIRGRVSSIPVFFHKIMDIDLSKKDFVKARKNFLWFGGTGLLHKGLDITLEIFDKRQDINLHVCGPISLEKKFQELYFDLLYNRKNIKTYDFIDLNSPLFAELLNKCAFTIFPSLSEAGCASILTVMGNGGLIPILSESSGLDIEEFGYVFEEINETEILKKIDEALKCENITERAIQCYNYTNSNYTISKYEENISNFLHTIDSIN